MGVYDTHQLSGLCSDLRLEDTQVSEAVPHCKHSVQLTMPPTLTRDHFTFSGGWVLQLNCQSVLSHMSDSLIFKCFLPLISAQLIRAINLSRALTFPEM